MSTNVEAIYEHGVLRPKEPLALADGEQVDLIVMKRTPVVIGDRLVTTLATIAALPLEGLSDEFSGRDHDRVLNGDDRKA
ncbi:MAG: antitoxin family protein [Pyrinomonadaceae bacterium]